jgi:hypothetical protein
MNKSRKFSGHILLFAFIVFFLLGLYIYLERHIEKFNLPSIGTRYICPTRNQSMDLRQDIPINRKDWLFMNSTIGPQNPNECVNHPLIL